MWKTSSTDTKWRWDLAEFVRRGGKRRELQTEDFFTINVQIKKEQERKLLWKANASETNRFLQRGAVVRRVTLRVLTACSSLLEVGRTRPATLSFLWESGQLTDLK